MLSGWLVALSMAVSPGQCTTCGPVDSGMTGGMAFSPGMSAGSWSAGMGGFGNPYDAVSMGGGGGGDQLYPFDSPEPWLWGYFQEIPAYGGYSSFRPHNYKHVLAQMDVAGQWGIAPTMAYSHQWYHRYRQRAGMHPNYGTPYTSNGTPGFGDIAAHDAGVPSAADRFYRSENGSNSLIQAAAMERGYSGTPIPGISVPDYQFARVPEGRNTVGDEYLSRIDQMQQRIDEQNYQMQVLQQQLQNSVASQTVAMQAGSPQYASSAISSGQEYPSPNAYAPSGYQELPPPAAYQYQSPVSGPQNTPLLVPQQGFGHGAYPQMPATPRYQQYPQPSTTGYAPAEAYQQPTGPTFIPQQFSLQQIPQPATGQTVYGTPVGNAPALPYGAQPNGQASFAVPQANHSDNGGGVPYQGGQPVQSSHFTQPSPPLQQFHPAHRTQPSQLSPPGVWQQPAPQTGLVPMGQPSQANAQASGYGASQPGGYFVPSNTSSQVHIQQPGSGPASVPYSGGSFVR
jgi:hypothetical protein